MAPEDIEKPVASIDAADRKAHASRPPSLLTLTHRKMSLPENAATIRPAPCAHVSRSLRPMHMGPVFCVRSPVRAVRRTGVSRFLGLLLAPCAHPFVEEASAPPALMH